LDVSAWALLFLWPILVAGFSGFYPLRRRATVPGLITTAVVCYGLFALWQIVAVIYEVRLFATLGVPAGFPWALVLYLGISAAVVAAASWYGWSWHRRLYPSRPLDEQALPTDGGKLAQ
jgi:hypothetical protein